MPESVNGVEKDPHNTSQPSDNGELWAIELKVPANQVVALQHMAEGYGWGWRIVFEKISEATTGEEPTTDEPSSTVSAE